MGKFSWGNPTVGHSRDSVWRTQDLAVTDIDMVFNHSKPAFQLSYDKVDSGVVLFCDGLIIVTRSDSSKRTDIQTTM